MKQWQLSDIDERINYFDFYSKYLAKLDVKKKDNARCLCPFHEDTHPSLSINLKTGQYKCFSCRESGNAITFLKKHCNMRAKEAYEHLAKMAGLSVEDTQSESAGKRRTNLKEYAAYKKLPVDFLTELGLKDEKDEFGSYVAIAYYDENNSLTALRKRISIQGNNGKNKFLWASKSKITLYGIWKIEEIRSQGYVILVEGESDTHTLMFHNRPVLGVPGAAFFEDEWVKFLQNLKVYVVSEPGISGQTFTKNICEHCEKSEFNGELKTIVLPGYKDPSDLHIKGGRENFNAVLDAAIEMAKPLKMVKTIFPGAPFQPIISDKWKCNLSGIYTYIKSPNDEMELVKISSTPMLISCNLPDIHSDEEKLELSFYKRGQWYKKIFERAIIFTNTKITVLANYGIDVTSENSKALIRYFSMLLRENIDRMPTVKTTNRLGWTEGMAFIPGHAEDIRIDAETENFEHILKGFAPVGTIEDFKEILILARSSMIARFTVAASFASPLLKLLDHRIFMVYLYGSSTGGKSASLSAAMSVWGNPNVIMQSFDATKVAFGVIAGIYQHLPVGIDEKQVAGNHQEILEQIAYALAGGKDRARGNKDGGLREQKTWKNIFLATGEVPYSTDSSATGVKTRLLELYSVKAFKDEAEAEKLHVLSQRYYGTAGVEFIGKLKTALANDSKLLFDLTDFYFKGLEPYAKQNIRAHLSATAVVCAADYLYSIWLLDKDEKQAAIEAANMGKFILANLDTLEDIDYSERGLAFIASWVATNKDRFKNHCRDTQYGFIDEKRRMCIAYQQLKEACIKEGFSPERILRDLAARGKIEVSKRDNNRIRYDVAKRMNGVTIRMVVFAEEFIDAGLFADSTLC